MKGTLVLQVADIGELACVFELPAKIYEALLFHRYAACISKLLLDDGDRVSCLYVKRGYPAIQVFDEDSSQ